jgi:hypothetical protein
MEGRISVVALLTWFPQAFPPPKRYFAFSSPAKSTVVVDVTVAAVVSTDITVVC